MSFRLPIMAENRTVRWLTIRRAATLGLLAVVLVTAPGCTSTGELVYSSFGNPPGSLDLPPPVDFAPSDEPVKTAQEHFEAGNYGLAARYYERAVEVMPNDGEAWLGLAASYDRIRRFDLADRAYRSGARYIGHRPEYHNNVGYSYLLRGELLKAQASFLRAYDLDPHNLTTINNLELLRDSLRRSKKAG